MSSARFAMIPVEAIRDSRMTLRDLRVLCALCLFADAQGVARPSRAQISAATGMHERHVSTATARLNDFGWIDKSAQAGAETIYTVLPTPDQIGHPTPDQIGHPTPDQIGHPTPDQIGHPTEVIHNPPLTIRIRERKHKEKNIVCEDRGVQGGKGKTTAPDQTKPADQIGNALATVSRQGTRLPADWLLPASWGNWAMENIPGATRDAVLREAAIFADYWHAKTGANATKLDWQATWRNWMRRANLTTHNGYNGYNGYQLSDKSRTRQAMETLLADAGEFVNPFGD